MGVAMGVDPMISQAIGARDHTGARRMLWQGVWLALIVSAVLTVPLLLFPLLLPIVGVQHELIEPATEYLVIRATGLAPFLLFIVVRSYLQAYHATRPLLISMIVCNVFNVFADIVLVFGGGILPLWTGPLRDIPSLGAAGAAVATVIGALIQLAIVASAVKHVNVTVDAPALHRWNRPEVARAFTVGWPLALQMGAEVGIFALVGLLAGRLGTMDLAAHQLVISVDSFTFTVALGVAAAGSVRVGLGVGAQDRLAARSAGHAAFIGGIIVMAVAALLFVAIPETLSRLLTDNQSVISVAVPLFLVAAVFQLSDGVQAVGAGVLRGAGDTRFALVANLFGHWAIGFPIAIFLGFYRNMGIVGLWWGLCAGLTAVAILLFIRFEKLSAKPMARIADAPVSS
jgi:MATE family multidrug resistance protein